MNNNTCGCFQTSHNMSQIHSFVCDDVRTRMHQPKTGLLTVEGHYSANYCRSCSSVFLNYRWPIKPLKLFLLCDSETILYRGSMGQSSDRPFQPWNVQLHRPETTIYQQAMAAGTNGSCGPDAESVWIKACSLKHKSCLPSPVPCRLCTVIATFTSLVFRLIPPWYKTLDETSLHVFFLFLSIKIFTNQDIYLPIGPQTGSLRKPRRQT